MKSPPAAPAPQSEKHKPSILVVEDSVALRYTLAEWLRIEGYAVLEAATADEALVVLQSPLPVDLVVTDVHMPGSMDGITLMRHIGATYPAIRVITVSGKAARLEIPEETVFFRKPYDLDKVTERIREMLTEPNPQGEGHL